MGWKVALAAACLALVASGIAIRALRVARADQDARAARLEADNRRWKNRAGELERETAAIRRGSPVPAGEPRQEVERGENAARINTLDQAKMLIQFREQLLAANRSGESLQSRIQELQFSLEKATEENKRLAASEAELREKVGVTNRVLEAVQNELKSKATRLAELDAANRRLHDENQATADKAAQLPRAMQELEQINRRREGYLTSILRRYRDITDQYRALSTRLDRDNSAAGSPELGGIQNTISMTEEDLRQLSALNAQAVRVQQKIAGK